MADPDPDLKPQDALSVPAISPPRAARRRRLWRILLGIVAGTMLLVIGFGLWLWSIEPKITIGKETTYLEGPLDAHGRVDYFAAVTELSREGVTPETNQAVVLTRIMPPGELSNANLWNELHRGLELKPDRDAPAGSMITSFTSFVRDLPVERLSHDESSAMLDRACGEPWSRKELPLVWSWVDRHAAALDLGVEASRRPHYFAPPISSGTPRVMSILLPLSQTSRHLAYALAARAMHRLNEGDLEGSWSDVMAVLRIGRAHSEAPPAIDRLVSVAIESIGVGAARGVAASPHLKQDFAETMQKDLASLPPRAPFARTLLSERLQFLDNLQTMLHEGSQMMSSSKPTLSSRTSDWLMQRALDWDEIARVGNEWFDRYEEAAAIPERHQRLQAAAALEDEFFTLARTIKSGADVGDAPPMVDFRRRYGRRQGQTMVTLLFPALKQLLVHEIRAETRIELLKVVVALKVWKLQHGGYPQALADLVPSALPELPNDFFTGKPLVYAVSETGVTVTSPGPDGLVGSLADDNSIAARDDVSLELP